MTAKIIFLNGPPRSGKDTLATFCMQSYQNIIRTKFATPLKKATHCLLGLDNNEDTFEETKSEESPDFFGKTPRQFYIELSEQFLKPRCGNDVFGYVWLRRNRHFFEYANVIIISDCGFAGEVVPIIKHYDVNNMCLIRLHRQGCDYTKDSRGYIRDIFPREADITNPEHTPEFMFNHFVKQMARWGFSDDLKPKIGLPLEE